MAEMIHEVVKAGDGFLKIAGRLAPVGITATQKAAFARAIATANGLTLTSTIYVGQILHVDPATIPTVTPPPVTPTPVGSFHVENGFIIDPNGRFFIPTGGGTVSRPTGIDPNDGYWGSNGHYSYGNGNVQHALAEGWNATEVMVPIPDPAAPFSMQQSLEGLGEMLREWTAAGIVCIVYPWWGQGYNPTSYATAPAEVRAVQDYLCANFANNQYVWLETMGEAWQWAGADGSGQWNNWSTGNAACFNDAVSKGWKNMQVFVLPQYGQGIGVMADSRQFDAWYSARNSDKVVFGWHNFGSEPTVAGIRARIQDIKSRKLPLICTSFGQNWNDGAAGFGQTGDDTVGVDFTFQYGWDVTLRTGGITWQASGPHNTNNSYSHRYCRNNGGVFRAWFDNSEPRNEVGQGIYNKGQLGYNVIGGGPLIKVN